VKKSDKLQFTNDLLSASTEEDVKNDYARHFEIRYNTADRHDLYTPQVLFEFKYDKNFESIRIRAATLAQLLYYVRRLKFSQTDKAIPHLLCLADRNEAILTETSLWKAFYCDDNYDWDLPASTPDAALVAALAATAELRDMHIFKVQISADYELFAEQLAACFCGQLHLAGIADKKLITEDNFEEVYNYWNAIFGESVRNGQKASKYFVSDIQQGRTIWQKDQGVVLFDIGNNEFRKKKILSRDYEHFWSLYERITSSDVVRGILNKLDRLTDDALRRFHGEFFTPLTFARKGLEYLEKTVGQQWWRGNYRLWDMAAGTGNLEWYIPTDAWGKVYLSTLYNEEVEHCRRLFPDATCFQYDYLNDDIDYLFSPATLPFAMQWKLPEQLRRDLADPTITWIILINPPFATSQTAGTSGKASKSDVSSTAVRKVMHQENLGEVSRELFAQFLFRIRREFEGRQAHLGLFSTLKYLNSTNDQKSRDTVFRFGFERGFIFSSANFSGTKKNNAFPVGFLVWNLADKRAIEEQEIVLDVFDTYVEKIDAKPIPTNHRDNFLSKWIDRLPATRVLPPFGSAIAVKDSNKDARDRVTEGFLASLMCCGNDLQHQNFTSLLSGPYVSAGALSVTAANFTQAMVVHAVRRLPKADWTNDRDQYMRPKGDLSDEFISDCTAWNLFSSSNQTAALKDVVYKGSIYQIHNHLFPFAVPAVKRWRISDADITLSLASAEDSFTTTWLRKQNLSVEARVVLDLGELIYRCYFENLANLRTPKFRIETWDAGWWQIRNALADQNLAEELFARMKLAHGVLKEKLLPQVYGLGFL
jgi:hypothetical protein